MLLATLRALLRVRQAEAALREANATLEQRVAERTAALQREVAERQQMQAALFQREKLAAMGSLLASVAHELNNPSRLFCCTPTSCRPRPARAPWQSTRPKLPRRPRAVSGWCQFLTLARQHAPERAVVDLNALLTEIIELLAPSLRIDMITVDLRLTAELPKLWADPHQLQQVVVNLVTNAQQALREVARRHLTLSTGVDPAQTRVTLEVRDTGLGMAPEVQARIFEPFFTTKPLGSARGWACPYAGGFLRTMAALWRVRVRWGRARRSGWARRWGPSRRRLRVLRPRRLSCPRARASF